jgi:RND family efflux transporter MFP subunit
MSSARGIILAFGMLGLLAGCGEEPESKAVERVRTIKPYFVSEPAGGDVRRYSGTIAASNISALSFAVAGTVATVDVENGESVVEGQVLATLDPESLELDVRAAQSQLASARANHDDKKTALQRKRTLFDKEWVAKAALDQAAAAFDAAEGELNLARSRLGSAERSLANARLAAPFDGVIASREVEPFEEVAVGQVLFLLNSKGALEVSLSIPDSVISRLWVGAPVTVEVSSVAGCGCSGRITEIGAISGSANVVEAKATLLESRTDLLPGMPAEVSVVLSGGGRDRGFLVPLAAIAPGDEAARGYVFKFDPQAGAVRKVPIRGGEGVAQNLVEIVEGVAPGDIIAAAGVSLLRDGQRVTLLGE